MHPFMPASLHWHFWFPIYFMQFLTLLLRTWTSSFYLKIFVLVSYASRIVDCHFVTLFYFFVVKPWGLKSNDFYLWPEYAIFFRLPCVLSSHYLLLMEGENQSYEILIKMCAIKRMHFNYKMHIAIKTVQGFFSLKYTCLSVSEEISSLTKYIKRLTVNNIWLYL